MDGLSFYLYIFSLIVFLLQLTGVITNDQKKKQLIFAGSYSFVIAVISGYFILDFYGENLPSNDLYGLSIAIIVPQCLQIISNLRHKTVYKNSNSFSSKSFRWIAFLPLIAVSSIPFFTIIDNETVIEKLLRESNGVILFIFFTLTYIQPKQAIYQSGILNKGTFWDWKDIQGFKISGNNLDKSLLPIVYPAKDFLFEAVFFIKKMPIWHPKQIHFYIPESQINILSIFLEQNIEKHNKLEK
jgi:hypothetical protein